MAVGLEPTPVHELAQCLWDSRVLATCKASPLRRQTACAATLHKTCCWPVAAVPLEFFAPVSSSIGVQLLQKMGWRQGKGIGSKGPSTAAARKDSRSHTQQPGVSHHGLDDALFGSMAEMAGFRGPSGAAAAAGSDSDEGDQHQQQQAGSSKWGTVAGVSIENTPLYVLEPKQDLHGLGFDPFEGAEEFRSRKRQKLDAARAATGGLSHTGEQGFGGSGSGAAGGKARGIAFGTGAMEESDTLGYMEDYIDADADVMAHQGRRNEMFAFEEATDSGKGRLAVSEMSDSLSMDAVELKPSLRAGHSLSCASKHSQRSQHGCICFSLQSPGFMLTSLHHIGGCCSHAVLCSPLILSTRCRSTCRRR